MKLFPTLFSANARVTPFGDASARLDAGRMGMWIFLAVLALLFLSAIFGYLFVRIENAATWMQGSPPPPPAILLSSTAALLLSSWTMHCALRAAQRGDKTQGKWMLATLALALLFLVLQAFAWVQLIQLHLANPFTTGLYAWMFYVLTGLHALHVFGGLVPLCATTARARRCEYGPNDFGGALYTAMYWHFLDGAWIVLYITLLLGSSS